MNEEIKRYLGYVKKHVNKYSERYPKLDKSQLLSICLETVWYLHIRYEDVGPGLVKMAIYRQMSTYAKSCSAQRRNIYREVRMPADIAEVTKVVEVDFDELIVGLSKLEQMVLRHYYVDDMCRSDVAAAINRSENRVSVLHKKAIARLYEIHQHRYRNNGT